MSTFSYLASIEDPEPATVCDCDNCDWKGTFEELAEIGEATLTPGDPSPAGRCPECEALAYVATVYQPLPGKESADWLRGYHKGQADMAASFNDRLRK